jgi:hypothetical protein
MRAIERAIGAGVLSVVVVACGGDEPAPSGGGATNKSGGPAGPGPAGTQIAPGAAVPGTTPGTATGAVAGNSPVIAGCNIFPNDNPWNQDISAAALSPQSATWMAKMAPTTKLHPDWGTPAEGYGIPFNTGKGATPVPMTWTTSWGARESDPLACPSGTGKFCYPIPSDAKIEAGGDAHLLYIDTSGAPSACTLYELFATEPFSGGGYSASNGAIFKLGSNALRTDGWTSADAAGLPILPGLVRYDEVAAGKIEHAIRFTVAQTQQGYIHPATHAAGKDDATLPPMGTRVRLKASVNITAPTEGMAIVTALKKYGMILADNGSNWYLSGEQHAGWASAISNVKKALDQLHGSDFEVVDTGPVSKAGLD